MEQQTNLTAVEWLVEKLRMIDKNAYAEIYDDIKAAKQMEKEQRIKDYNSGYTDAQCNHVNDAENYANEIEYIQSQIDHIDNEIKRKQDKIASSLINGSNK